jgi:MSHA biogenesis protein MshG
MVVVAIGIAIVILNVFALPAFAKIFEEFNAELPLPTRILIATSQLSTRYGVHSLAALALVVWGVRAWLATPKGRERWERAKLRLPVLGLIIEKATLARFARTFALSLRSGVPMIPALGVSARVVDNSFVAGRIAEIQSHVERGEALTRTAAASGLFTPLVLQMMGVGEETGALDDLMQQVAEFYERDVEYELKRVSAGLDAGPRRVSPDVGSRAGCARALRHLG